MKRSRPADWSGFLADFVAGRFVSRRRSASEPRINPNGPARRRDDGEAQPHQPSAQSTSPLCFCAQRCHFDRHLFHRFQLVLGRSDVGLEVSCAENEVVETSVNGGTAVVSALQPIFDTLNLTKDKAKGAFDGTLRHSVSLSVRRAARRWPWYAGRIHSNCRSQRRIRRRRYRRCDPDRASSSLAHRGGCYRSPGARPVQT